MGLIVFHSLFIEFHFHFFFAKSVFGVGYRPPQVAKVVSEKTCYTYTSVGFVDLSIMPYQVPASAVLISGGAA